MDETEVEDLIRRYREDANQNGPAYFEQITLSPLVGKADWSDVVINSKSSDHSLSEPDINQRSAELAGKIIPGESPEAVEARQQKQSIFEYIIGFWERSTVGYDLGCNTGGGLNLALRPFVAPTGQLPGSPFQYNEQYRWDTYFQNLGLNLAGATDLALDQLKNKVDVFALMGLIPNALTTSLTSHGQPPLEALEAKDLLAKIGPGDWYGKVMKTIEQDLWNNWLDAGKGIKAQRQSIAILKDNYLLTRHSNIHLSPVLVGCEDGKDHYEITHIYGVNYLPVQLNAILQGHLERLQDYYENFAIFETSATEQEKERATRKASEYKELASEHKRQFQEVFWEGDDERWRGFRNYALAGNGYDGQEGRIKFDDLSAEVFPLVFGLATTEQSEIIKDNIMNHYAGDQGLSSTNPETREGGVDFKDYIPKNDGFNWSAPNCWPPLMYMATEGLERYGFVDDARDLRARWIRAQEKNFYDTGYFHEKSVFDSSYSDVTRGLYGNIKGGFGWTIGVYLYFVHKQQG